MFRPLAVNVGLRYARSKRSFISFVSVMALTGLALSVAVLLFVQAVAHGFERELNHRLLGVVPHFTVFGLGPIVDVEGTLAAVRETEGVTGAAAVAVGNGLVATDARLVGVELRGIRPREYAPAIERFVEHGALEALAGGAFNILLGHGVTQALNLNVGDAVTVVLPDATVTPFGAFPRRKTFRVAGLVRTHSMLDERSAYLHIEDAQRLFRLDNAVHAIEARIHRPLEAAETGARAGREALGAERFRLVTWFRSLGPLYRTIQVTKGTMFVVFSLLVAVAAFNVVSSLVMIVNERRSDVAILRTVGGRTGLIVAVFVVLGFLITSVGAALGLALGFALGGLAENGYAWAQAAWGLDLMSQYLVHTLPVEFAAADVARVALTAGASGLLATLYPAWRAARVNPAEVLKHE